MSGTLTTTSPLTGPGGGLAGIAVALAVVLSRGLAGLYQVHESGFLIFEKTFSIREKKRRNNLLAVLSMGVSRSL